MTTTTIRPDGTLSALIGTLVGGATAHAVLSDNSDASYIKGQGGGIESVRVVLTLGTFTIPAGSVVKSAVVRARIGGALGGYPAVVSLLNNRGVSGLLVALAVTSTTVTTTYSSSAQAVQLSQADLDALLVEIYSDTGESAFTTDVRHFEVYADIITAAQPVVTVTAPTGTITTTSYLDTIWSYAAGVDGGPQSSYQVRIFSAAEYGVAGFNPGTSPASYDSGVLFGTTSNHRSASLPNATYRSYVRAAQSINGVAHWSDWAFSQAVLNATGPTVASVVATSEVALARNRITVTRSGAVAWTSFDLQRSDDAGVTWVPVRGVTAAIPPGDVWIGYDYEAPNGVTVQYRARGTTVTGISGAWTLSSTLSWTSDSAWMKDPRYTAKNTTLRMRSWPEPTRGRRMGVHRVVGRADPIVVTDIRQLITGEFVIYTATQAEADALLDLLDSNAVLVQSPARYRFGSRWIIVGDIKEMRGSRMVTEQIRWWSVPFVEVLAPLDEGVAISGGLTWSDINSVYATWQALLDTGKTWGTFV